MTKTIELSAVDKAIEKTGVFFCRHCWMYRPLASRITRGKRKICAVCVAKIEAAKY